MSLLSSVHGDLKAEQRRITLVGDAFADANSDGDPDRKGDTVTVRGVLLSDPVLLNGGACLVNLQDRSGGVVLFTRRPELLRGRVQRGDLIEATGTVSIFRGNQQLQLKDIGRIGRGELPSPKVVAVADLRKNAGVLVKVAGQLIVAPDFLTRKEPVMLRDHSGAIQVPLVERLFAKPEFVERFQRGGQLEMVGIPVLSEGAAGPAIRLIARDSDDFHFAPIPPYREIAVAAGVAGLLAWAAVTVSRRRRADQRAREMSAEAKRAAEERDRFFTLSLDMLCIANADGYFKRLNPAFTQTLGWSMKELLERPFIELVHLDDRPATLAAMAKVAAGECLFSFENRLRCKDASWRAFSWRAVSQPDGVIYATLRDVTEQRNTEAALRALNSELEQRVSVRTAEVRQALATLDATDDGAFIFDPETLRFTYVNNGAVRLLGYTREELFAMTPGEIESAHDAAQFRELLAPMIRGEVRLRQITTNYRRKDGQDISVEINLQYVAPAGEQPRFITIARDVTERRKSENLLRRSQRLEALGALASGVAHDLNNALTPILMSIGVLKSEFPADGQLIDTVQASAQRGAEMVRQLLTFAKGVEGNYTAIPPARLLQEVEQMTRFTFPKNIRVEVHCEDNLPAVRGDTTQLHQVLLNLGVNARDAMPQGGTLTLEARAVDVDTAIGAIPEARPGHYVVLRVSDTGTGIPPEIMDRIFDPFFTTKTPEQGTGLGLSTVIGIMKSHGGFMQVYSQVGRGSTFSAFLPAADVEVDTLRGSRPGSEFRGRDERVLVVDDEPAVREAALVVLRRLRFTPIVASDGSDGLVQAAQHRGSLRVIITDLHMPNVNGLAFVRTLRRTHPRIPIVVTTGRMEAKEREECRLLGVRAFLEKPFSEAQLANVMRSVLATDDQQGSEHIPHYACAEE